jgi:hypothetical protein
MPISEFEFLNKNIADIEPRLIYVYRTGFLKPAIVKHMNSIADFHGLMKQSASPQTLPQQLIQPGLFVTEAMAICEIGTLKADEFAGIQTSLNLIAEGAVYPFCLIVSAKNRITSEAAWKLAAKNSLVIDESYVSKGNLPAVFRFLLHRNGLGGITAKEKTVAYSALQGFVADDSWGLDWISKKLDFLVLAPGNVDEEFDNDRKNRGDVLNECLKDFLDESAPHVMRRLLKLLDEMKSRRLMNNQDIVIQLYLVTVRIISGTDKRYRHNKLGLAPPSEYFTWALHLLANQHTLISGAFLAAVERQCRNFMNIGDHSEWLADPLNWTGSFRRSAFNRHEPSHEPRLEKQRSSLVNSIFEAFAKMTAMPPSVGAAMEELAHIVKQPA